MPFRSPSFELFVRRTKDDEGWTKDNRQNELSDFGDEEAIKDTEFHNDKKIQIQFAEISVSSVAKNHTCSAT